MQIKGKTFIVTGAGGGIGRHIVELLVAAGAAKVYAAARRPETVAAMVAAHPGIVQSVTFDITDPKAVAAAAAACKDVEILINNAAINRFKGVLAAPDLSDARAEIETNYLGTLSMCRAFAPVLKANGGGVIVNMLSIVARVPLPVMGSLSASKAATASMTQSVRAELAGQGTFVMAVFPGSADTEMNRPFPPPKMPPIEVAQAMLKALERDEEDVYPGDQAQGIAAALATDPKGIEKELAKVLPG
jgi:NAD(P)-dependent dehydrogenase (short-subunit alcohol dehydrogenase family)